jgi:hypothetical protein
MRFCAGASLQWCVNFDAPENWASGNIRDSNSLAVHRSNFNSETVEMLSAHEVAQHELSG